MSICLKGGRVIDPANGLDKRTDLFVEDGAILAIGKAPPGTQIDSTIDVSGKYVLPGLIDLGAHLREPGYEYKGDISSELRPPLWPGDSPVFVALPTHVPL